MRKPGNLQVSTARQHSCQADQRKFYGPAPRLPRKTTWLALATVLLSAAGNSSDDQKRLGPRPDRLRQRGIGRLKRQVPLAGEEAHERSALLADMVTDRSAKGRVARLERIEDRSQSDRALDINLDLAANQRKPAQVCRQDNPDHGSVWTSTEHTAGRSRTMAVQLSPPSRDA